MNTLIYFKNTLMFIVDSANPPFFLCLNMSFVFTNYQPIQLYVSSNKAIRTMHRYCIMQQGCHKYYISIS